MITCPNCGSQLGCSCQRRTASNGKACCSNCVARLESQLKMGIKPDDQLLTPAQKVTLSQS